MILAGRCPSDVAPVFFGGRLLALNKKSGGVRPMAVGFTLRRLASKCANAFGVNHLKGFPRPHQRGVDTPGGCEAAIHSACRYLEALPADHVMVKLDFTNAFNSLHRHDMLISVLSRVPELYAYCVSAYSHPSTLFYGSYVISSEEGRQQGDPLGPLLFCNTIQPLLFAELWVESWLSRWCDTCWSSRYCSFWCSGDYPRWGAMGPVLNTGKCELIAHQDCAQSLITRGQPVVTTWPERQTDCVGLSPRIRWPSWDLPSVLLKCFTYCVVPHLRRISQFRFLTLY